MADIYLTKKQDRKKYAACFKEVVEKRPTVDSCILLGNAFLKIQEVVALHTEAAPAFISLDLIYC